MRRWIVVGILACVLSPSGYVGGAFSPPTPGRIINPADLERPPKGQSSNQKQRFCQSNAYGEYQRAVGACIDEGAPDLCKCEQRAWDAYCKAYATCDDIQAD